MSKPQPSFHNLKISSDASFWTEGLASERRAFLMPLANPYEFLAFGILGQKREVSFVARGTVSEHLGAFISHMVREGAVVELRTRAPVPGWLLKQYDQGGHFEGHEFEEPPPQPVNGIASVRTDTSDSEPSWGEGDALSRRVILLPVKDSSRFLAIGTLNSQEKLLFVREGSVRNELCTFIERMVREEARVELHARPPLPEPLWRPFISSASGEGAHS